MIWPPIRCILYVLATWIDFSYFMTYIWPTSRPGFSIWHMTWPVYCQFILCILFTVLLSAWVCEWSLILHACLEFSNSSGLIYPYLETWVEDDPLNDDRLTVRDWLRCSDKDASSVQHPDFFCFLQLYIHVYSFVLHEILYCIFLFLYHFVLMYS